jgi:hypothetical protein
MNKKFKLIAYGLSSLIIASSLFTTTVQASTTVRTDSTNSISNISSAVNLSNFTTSAKASGSYVNVRIKSKDGSSHRCYTQIFFHCKRYPRDIIDQEFSNGENTSDYYSLVKPNNTGAYNWDKANVFYYVDGELIDNGVVYR